jgi:FtsP/CotA-like multicopper oxidase with cupredoxin domain
MTMDTMGRYFLALCTCGVSLGGAMAQTGSCPARPPSNSMVKNPPDLTAINGLLKVDLTLRSRQMLELPLKVCYVYESSSGPVEAPTLRLDPGDELQLSLTDRLTYVRPHTHPTTSSPAPHDPCAGGAMATTSTNIDFHGLDIPPDCHQGEVSVTAIENTDPAFEYKIKIPKDNPPGMYWYHPHLQGSATLQLNGGASGVVIVGGMEKAKPEVAGLPERILVVRQTFEEDDPESWPPGESRLSLNFQPAVYPHLPSPVIQMKPGAREFWRVANATSQAFLALRVVFGNTSQTVKLVGLDGVPVRKSLDLRTIELPPGGRAEFIVTAPAALQAARLLETEVETGRTGFENPPQELAKIVASAEAQQPPALGGGPARAAEPASARHSEAPLAEARATAVRKLYFAEATNGTNGPTRYFLTVEGQTPKLFDPSGPPAVVTKVGAVEDWIIANHSGEIHAFHMHGMHFALLQASGRKLPNPELRDTVTVPAWDGAGPYPTVTLRMDFRDPRSAGTFVFHCHILHHAEAGMMAMVLVNP